MSILRRLRRQLVSVLVVYAVGGVVSQKLIPGVDEIFPLFGWSLFSRIPNYATRYTIIIDEHDGVALDPPLSFHQAPSSIVTGNRYIARKLLQSLGRAHDEGDTDRVQCLRHLLEENYLQGAVRYELIFEGFAPLEKWKTGKNRERRSLVSLEKGDPR